LIRIDDNIPYVNNLDVLDGIPRLDIKPYGPRFDTPPDFHLAWLDKVKGKVRATRSDKCLGRGIKKYIYKEYEEYKGKIIVTNKKVGI
jgi:hypothetical protein